MVARTAIADMFDRSRAVSAVFSAGMGSAFSGNFLAELFAELLLGELISLTKTNGAASDASGLLNATIAILERRSCNDD